LQVPDEPSQLMLQQSLSCEQPSPDAPPDAPPQVPSHVPHVPPQQSLSWPHAEPSCAQPQAPSTHCPPQQSLSSEHPAPSAAPEAPPQVLSHVPHEPPQQSLSSEHPAPSAPPEMPPQVLSHVPQLAPLQQSASSAQVSPLSAHPHTPPLVQDPEQQSLATLHASPSCAPEAPPQVLSHVPHEVPAVQQSLSDWQVPPDAEQGVPHVPLLHTNPSALQQSVSVVQVSPLCPQAGAAQAPLVHTFVPQQSLSAEQVSPAFAQPHVPALQMLGAQQSLLSLHEAPAAWQAHVIDVGSQLRAPQQSPSEAQACPLDAQAPPSAPPPAGWHVIWVASHVKPVQQSEAVAQSPS
jgi:hypothetical protein